MIAAHTNGVPAATGSAPLLQLEEVRKYFPVRRGLAWWRPAGQVKAVDGVSLTIDEGTTIGLVGESGCGKTTVAKLLLLLETPTDGAIRFYGKDVRQLRGREVQTYRQTVQAVFQDPFSSLNPRMRVRDIVAEPLVVHTKLSSQEVRTRVGEVLDVVGLSSHSRDLFPHEFSGGQRQRIAIARAMSLNPKVLVLDEPVSALDVSIRAQILNLLMDIQRQYHLTYLLIAHDLAIVEHVSTLCGVMYLGTLVELSESRELYGNALHPYTKALISAVPIPDPEANVESLPISGEIPSPLNPPSGCRFHTRCPFAMPRCSAEIPLLRAVQPGHQVACHLFD
ncbi:MAG: ATP-binding cassette domain-containing protein [Chloroflexi bacterium]|nr:ATP-binding cassette domain-containing protein [Chloroflexota bacterium]